MNVPKSWLLGGNLEDVRISIIRAGLNLLNVIATSNVFEGTRATRY